MNPKQNSRIPREFYIKIKFRRPNESELGVNNNWIFPHSQSDRRIDVWGGWKGEEGVVVIIMVIICERLCCLSDRKRSYVCWAWKGLYIFGSCKDEDSKKRLCKKRLKIVSGFGPDFTWTITWNPFSLIYHELYIHFTTFFIKIKPVKCTRQSFRTNESRQNKGRLRIILIE